MAFDREKIKTKTTDDLVANFSRVAQTSHYSIQFLGVSRLTSLTRYLAKKGVDSSFVARDLGEYCRRASLPGTRLFKHEAKDQFPGVTQKFVYKRQFEDLQLTFYVDYEVYWVDC